MNLIDFLSEKRYEHSLSVAQTAKTIAESVAPELAEKAYFAGYWHDLAKEFSPQTNKKYIDLIKKNISEPEMHGHVAAFILQDEMGINDEDTLNSIRNHTIPNPKSSTLEKIIYVADKVEPTRKHKSVNKLFHMALKDIDKAFIKTVADAYKSIEENGKHLAGKKNYLAILKEVK